MHAALMYAHRVDDATYSRAATALGDRGVIDMVVLIGLYMIVCAIINAFEIPLQGLHQSRERREVERPEPG